MTERLTRKSIAHEGINERVSAEGGAEPGVGAASLNRMRRSRHLNSTFHQEFPQPDDPTVLAWRYLDLPKLLSLLLKKQLYLTRLDSLEDKYEGTLPPQTLPATLAELRPTITSARAWPMIEKSLSFLRKFRNPQSMEKLAVHYFKATPEGSQDRFAAVFLIFWLFVVMQLTRIRRAAALASLEAKNENLELQDKLDDTNFYKKLGESTGILPETQLLNDLEENYERIPPEGREAAIRELADWALMQYSNIRQNLFVNCWHLGHHESEAMWRIYCGREDGIAIVLPYSRLRDSIKATDTFIGKVEYIPYETGMLKRLGQFSPGMHKRQEFEHENEARIVQRRVIDSGSELSVLSVQIAWDPEAYIERIVISPYSRPWYADVVQGIVDKVAPLLSGKLQTSAMRAPPFAPGSGSKEGP